MTSGFPQIFNELESSGFIKKYLPFGRSKRDSYYRLVDEYTFFYKKWIEPVKNGKVAIQKNHMLLRSQSPAYNAWAGYKPGTIQFLTKLNGAGFILDIFLYS